MIGNVSVDDATAKQVSLDALIWIRVSTMLGAGPSTSVVSIAFKNRIKETQNKYEHIHIEIE
jgi:hypothetical protein